MRTDRGFIIFFGVGVLCTVAGFASSFAQARPAARPTTSAPAAGRNIQGLLKQKVAASEKDIGRLDPWQKRIFNEEVLPQYGSFVRDYRPSGDGGGVSADIDLTAIAEYLRFYAPKTISEGSPVASLAIWTEKGNAKCEAGLVKVKALVGANLERRGFRLDTIPPSELSVHAPSITKPFPDFENLLKARKSAAGLWLACGRGLEEGDEDVPSHPNPYLLRLGWTIVANAANRQLRQGYSRPASIQVLENEEFDVAAAKLWINTFTDLGLKVKEDVLRAGSQAPALILVVSGVRSYPQVLKLKELLQRPGSGVSAVWESRMSRSEIEFTVQTARPAEDMKNSMQGWDLGAGKLEIREVKDRWVRADVL